MSQVQRVEVRNYIAHLRKNCHIHTHLEDTANNQSFPGPPKFYFSGNRNVLSTAVKISWVIDA